MIRAVCGAVWGSVSRVMDTVLAPFRPIARFLCRPHWFFTCASVLYITVFFLAVFDVLSPPEEGLWGIPPMWACGAGAVFLPFLAVCSWIERRRDAVRREEHRRELAEVQGALVVPVTREEAHAMIARCCCALGLDETPYIAKFDIKYDYLQQWEPSEVWYYEHAAHCGFAVVRDGEVLWYAPWSSA